MKREKFFNLFFVISMIIKAFDGFLELLGGLFFIILKKQQLLNILSKMLNYNFFKISNETILKLVTEISNSLTTNIKVFISIILVCNGITKIGIAAALLLKKLMVFPFAIGFLILLLLYQIIEVFYKPSLALILFNIFDVLVIFVIWMEYKNLKKQKFH